jgi:hypothetical protein
MSGAAGRHRDVAAAPGRSAALQRSPGGTSGVRMATENFALPHPGRLARRPAAAPVESRDAPAPGLFLQSLIGCGGSAMNAPGKGDSSPLTVSSPDLPGGTFPRAFTCDGANRLPRLEWSTPPPGTQELAIEMLDPDAPGGTFTHWLVYGLPPGLSSLTAVPAGAAEGVNDFGRRGYGVRARRAAPRTTTISWSLRWTPGSVWRPGRGGPIWSHAPAVTCSAGANWSPPTSAPSRAPILPGAQIAQNRSICG